jgi:hypothetical protein
MRCLELGGVRKTGYSKAEGTKTGTSCAVVEIDKEGGLALTDRLGLDLALYSVCQALFVSFPASKEILILLCLPPNSVFTRCGEVKSKLFYWKT